MANRDFALIAILILAVIAISSAAAVFQEIKSVTPFMKASWRLQVTTFFQFFGCVYEFKKDRNCFLNM